VTQDLRCTSRRRATLKIVLAACYAEPAVVRVPQ